MDSFRLIVADRLHDLRHACDRMRAEPGDRTAIAQFVRGLHTLKGEAAAYGLAPLSTLAHSLESVVHPVIRAEAGPGDEILDCIEVALELADAVLTAAPGRMPSAVEQFCADPLAGARTIRRTRRDETEARLPSSVTLDWKTGDPGDHALQVLGPTFLPDGSIARLARSFEKSPALSQGSPGSGDEARRTGGPLDEMRRTSGGSSSSIDGMSPPGGSSERADIPAVGLGTTARVEFADLEDLYEVSQELVRRCRSNFAAIDHVRRTAGSPESGEDTVATDHGHELRRRVASATAGLHRDTTQLLELAADLETRARELCTVPLTGLFARCRMIAEQVARQLGREVVLIHEGGSIRVSRAVAEWLEQALLHLMRNAVDHGIEPPAQRIAAGKPAAGTIAIQVDVRDGHLQLSVSDDGAGIDADVVRARLVALSLLDEATAAALPDDEVLRALFSPSLSTRGEVTEYSGRGMGLEVVAYTARGLGGDVQLSSQPGTRTTTSITMPVGNCVLPLLVYRVGTRSLALPGDAVKGSAWCSADAIRLVHNRHGAMPVIDMPTLLGQLATETSGPIHAQVVGWRGEYCALTGVAKPERVYVPARAITPVTDHAPMVAGRVRFPHGGEACLLDVAAVIDAATRPRAEPPRSSSPTVLIVDDSPVIRFLLARSLRKRGMLVIEADGGRAGLEKLATSQRIDLVITDTEMPKLDGLTLIRELRARPATAHIPVIVLSAHQGEPDRAAALAAGADVCLVKESLRSATFDAAISRLLGSADSPPAPGEPHGFRKG